MRSVRSLMGLALVGFFAVGLACSALAEQAQEAGDAKPEVKSDWDQEGAAKTAAEFAAAVEKLYVQAKVDDQNTASTASGAESYLLVEDLKMLRRHSRRLQRELEKGSGREETLRLYQRLELLIRNARTAKQSAPILQGSEQEIEAARAVMNRLRAYYGAPPVTE
jgi:hypothetical protein